MADFLTRRYDADWNALMLRYSYVILMMVLASSCGESVKSSFPGLKEAKFATSAGFARDGYTAHFPILNASGRKIIDISCYSLDDDHREAFAWKNKSDPVADLSCYVKDIGRADESTMLGLDGESLQFTPGFFWFSDVVKCGDGSYNMTAKLRGVSISFIFSRISRDTKRSDLVIQVSPDTSATNERLTDQSFRSYCS
tara:strand:+ start:69067 stop:69660 length:594 start_codon:yes stop_codon:yes gene_type:complete